jgi:hypothetical protein
VFVAADRFAEFVGQMNKAIEPTAASSVDDLWRRAGVPAAAIVQLADADAFRPSLRHCAARGTVGDQGAFQCGAHARVDLPGRRVPEHGILEIFGRHPPPE